MDHETNNLYQLAESASVLLNSLPGNVNFVGYFRKRRFYEESSTVPYTTLVKVTSTH